MAERSWEAFDRCETDLDQEARLDSSEDRGIIRVAIVNSGGLVGSPGF